MTSSRDPSLERRYTAIRERLQVAATRAGREGQVTLVAVSKFQPAEAIEALYQLGHRDFGENYVQELTGKATALKERCPEIRWHFIGHLQTNKVKLLAPHVSVVHSIDSLRLAEELDKRWRQLGRTARLPVLIEVNVDIEQSKSGVSQAETPALASAVAALPGLELRGLMCIPSPEMPDPRPAFRALREFEASCRPHTRGELSMGMTSDFEEAIAEGASYVRIGTAIFGERPPQ